MALLIDIPRAAGASASAGFAAASITLPSIILAVSGAVGLVLTMVTGRFELQAKRQYLGTLRAMGWNPDMLGQVRLFENAMVGTVALPGVVGARHRPPPRPLCRTVGRYCRSCGCTLLDSDCNESGPMTNELNLDGRHTTG